MKNEKPQKRFTGYKIAIKHNGKYLSPATGVEYESGKSFDKLLTSLVDYKELSDSNIIIWFLDCLDEQILSFGSHYSKEMEGKTGVFKTKDSANKFLRSCLWDRSNHCILEMTIEDKDGLKTGILNKFYPIVIGSKIISQEEIETK